MDLKSNEPVCMYVCMYINCLGCAILYCIYVIVLYPFEKGQTYLEICEMCARNISIDIFWINSFLSGLCKLQFDPGKATEVQNICDIHLILSEHSHVIFFFLSLCQMCQQAYHVSLSL